MASNFDVLVIGAGPGGYVAAIRAAQLGLRTACIDDWQMANGKPALGGTCTNVGCIPSKALLQSSECYEHAGHDFATHGIRLDKLDIDLAQMQARKSKIVKQNNDGIAFLFKKYKVEFFSGRGSFIKRSGEQWEITVNGKEVLTAKHVVLATGSQPRALPGTAFDHSLILDNADALALTELPSRLGIVGAGVIGLELGSVWRRLGSVVTILEALPDFLGIADVQIAQEALKLFGKQDLDIQLGAKITKIVTKKSVTVEYADAAGKAQNATFDKLIVAIGRVPNTTGLNGEVVGLAVDARGFIVVDEVCRSNLPNVWAVGDVVRGPMLAHKAEEEGIAVAERIAGNHAHVDFNTIPSVIYTAPEIAWVGQTEQQLKKSGIEYRVGSFPFVANGRARAMGDTDGRVKMLADAITDRILGVHIIGPAASELIAEAVVAMEFGASSEDIALICHAHPTLSEALKEAALAVGGRPLNQ